MDPEKIETVLDKAGDWLRFSGYNWLVATNYSASDVAVALRATLNQEDGILIIRCDPNDYNGFAAPWVWEWVNKYRAPASSALLSDAPNPLAPASSGLLSRWPR